MIDASNAPSPMGPPENTGTNDGRPPRGQASGSPHDRPVAWLRRAGIIEGISWLVLLFIAMPLKYGLGQPMAVRIVGSVHGGLFVLFVGLLAWAHFARRWSMLRSAGLFVSALLPFGFLFVDQSLRCDLGGADVARSDEKL